MNSTQPRLTRSVLVEQPVREIVSQAELAELRRKAAAWDYLQKLELCPACRQLTGPSKIS